jgi:hypothetical protein
MTPDIDDNAYISQRVILVIMAYTVPKLTDYSARALKVLRCFLLGKLRSAVLSPKTEVRAPISHAPVIGAPVLNRLLDVGSR